MVGLSLLTAVGGLCGLVAAKASYNNTATYTNPILDGVGADPWVIQDGGVSVMNSEGIKPILMAPVLLHDIHHQCQHHSLAKHELDRLERC